MSEFAPELDDAVSKLARVLGEHEDYAVIGGLAVPIHSFPRATLDIDLLLTVPRIRLPGILERLVQEGFTLEVRTVLLQLHDDHLAQIRYCGIRVDLMDALLPSYRDVVRLARWEDLHGHRMRVASAEGLLFLKLLAFRTQDQFDLRSILAAQHGKLDFDIVRRLYSQVGEIGDERWRFLERVVGELDEEAARRSS